MNSTLASTPASSGREFMHICLSTPPPLPSPFWFPNDAITREVIDRSESVCCAYFRKAQRGTRQEGFCKIKFQSKMAAQPCETQISRQYFLVLGKKSRHFNNENEKLRPLRENSTTYKVGCGEPLAEKCCFMSKKHFCREFASKGRCHG